MTARLGEDHMAKIAVATTFRSSALKYASDNAMKKREFVRDAISHGRITTSEGKESFRGERSQGKSEKVRAGATGR